MSSWIAPKCAFDQMDKGRQIRRRHGKPSDFPSFPTFSGSLLQISNELNDSFGPRLPETADGDLGTLAMDRIQIIQGKNISELLQQALNDVGLTKLTVRYIVNDSGIGWQHFGYFTSTIAIFSRDSWHPMEKSRAYLQVYQNIQIPKSDLLSAPVSISVFWSQKAKDIQTL